MPRGDGTGPMGMGRMTGRGAGFCNGFAVGGYANPTGFGCGFGRGRGFRRMYNATGLPAWVQTWKNEPVVNEKELLSKQAEFLEGQLEEVKKRLSNFKEEDE